MPLHSLVRRQLKKYVLDLEANPSLAAFVDAVSEAYTQFDEDRRMIERSLEISSHELLTANSEMRQVLENFPDIYEAFQEKGASYDYNELITRYVQGLRESNAQREEQARLLRRQADELEIARDKALEAAHAKSMFLANMSHEIRTPLNAILGMLHLACSTELTESQRTYLGLAKESSVALLSVISDVLDFSKVDAGKLELEVAPFSLHDIVRQVVHALAVRAEEKHNELAAFLDGRIPHVCIGDAARIRQALLNIVGNAVKFTSDGEVSLSVDVAELQDDRVEVRFTVTDTGIGIPTHRQQRIFEAFVQADGSTTRRFGGSGLGLAISSKLVCLMGGTLEFRSVPGNGSTFFFTLPLRCERTVCLKPASTVTRTVVLALVSTRARLRLQKLLHCTGLKVVPIQDPHDASPALIRALEECDGPVTFISDMFASQALTALFAPFPEQVKARLSVVELAPLSSLVHQRDSESHITRVCKPFIDSDILALLSTELPSFLTVREPTTEQLVHTESKPVANPLRILVTDDILTNRLVAQHLLTSLGHEVSLANSGPETLDQLRHRGHFQSAPDGGVAPFDLLLLDIQMPEMDGIETAQKIREMEGRTVSGRRLPIIAFSAHALKGDRERFLEAGMDDYLSKPLDPERLKFILERIGERNRMTTERRTGSSAHASLPVWERLSTVAEKYAAMRNPEIARGEPVLNALELGERFGNDARIVAMIIDAYFEEDEQLLQELRSQIERADVQYHAVRTAAHAIKGSCLNLSVAAAGAAAIELEHFARDVAEGRRTADHSKLQQDFRALEEELRLARKAMLEGQDLLKQSVAAEETGSEESERRAR